MCFSRALEFRMEEKADRLPKGVLTARVACLRMIFIWPVACWGCVLVMPYPSILQGIIRLFFFFFLAVNQKGSTKPAATPREQEHGQAAGSSPSCLLPVCSASRLEVAELHGS